MTEPVEHEILTEKVRDLIQGILKARKVMRIYPPNNPLYINASEMTHNKFKEFFELDKKLSLKIFQNELIFNDERVYYNPGRDDNLALFFFKDGIREITFLSGLSQKELEDFMRILNINFETDDLDDDIVTLLWEKDFEHIKYVVDENFLLDEEVHQEDRTYEKIKDNAYSDDALARAYHDGLQAEAGQVATSYPISDTDLQYISSEIQQQTQPKSNKLITILFELLYQAKDLTTFREISRLIEATLGHCFTNGDFKNINYILEQVKTASNNRVYGDEGMKVFNSIYDSINRESYVMEIGKTLESKAIIEEEFIRFARHLNKSTIPFFLHLMEEIESLKGRHLIIEALTIIGRHDIKALAEGLNDERWEVIRDTIHILGRIGTSGALEYLTKVLSHPEEKVRREAIRTIGDIKNHDSFQYLKNALSDKASSVRIAAARAISKIKTEGAKKVLLAELSKKGFSSRDFNEKKEFFALIAHWSDMEVKDFLMKTLKKRRLWGRKRNDETRACAAHVLGLICAKESIPLLQKASKEKTKVLREYSSSALKRLMT